MNNKHTAVIGVIVLLGVAALSYALSMMFKPAPAGEETAAVATTTASVPVEGVTETPITHPYGKESMVLNSAIPFADFTITPLKVLTDSRCPTDPGVRCIQAGTVTVSVLVENANGSTTVTATLGKPVSTKSATITLESVTPEKTVANTGKIDNYEFVFDIQKKAGAATASAGNCVIGGCSKELCTDAAAGPVASTCVYTPSFICYRHASCERQATGKCGWTQTSELKACLANPPQPS